MKKIFIPLLALIAFFTMSGTAHADWTIYSTITITGQEEIEHQLDDPTTGCDYRFSFAQIEVLGTDTAVAAGTVAFSDIHADSCWVTAKVIHTGPCGSPPQYICITPSTYGPAVFEGEGWALAAKANRTAIGGVFLTGGVYHPTSTTTVQWMREICVLDTDIFGSSTC